MLSALDHVAVVVHDLDAAVTQLQVFLGRMPSWRGADGGAAHAWFQLSNMALDVIAPVGAGSTGDRVQAQLDAHGEGLWAIAFATQDIQKEIRSLGRRGVHASEARPIRSTHVESGEKRYWMTSVLEHSDTHGPTIFLVEQKPDAAPWPASEFNCPQSAGVSGLDHVVITTARPERAAAFYGARLDLEMALDRTNPEWNSRLLFFRCADLIVEVAHDLRKAASDDPDKAWGLSWRAVDVEATRARLAAAGVDVSDVRTGRRPGTRVLTVRDHTCNVPTIVLGRAA